jgi:hypothetical protein
MIFQVSIPNEVPGVYRITNKGSGHCYIGSTADLRRRLRNWQFEFANKSPNGVRLEQACGPSLDPDGWAFTVIEELPGATAEFLMEREGVHLKNEAVTRRGKLLNTQLHLASKAHHLALTEIFTDNGTPISYADASALTGYSKASLEQKLARLREKGITTVKLSDLKNPGRGRPRSTT